jgi:hypothetical protein
MRLRASVVNPGFWFAAALAGAGLLAGCGGGGNGVSYANAQPAVYGGATASPTPSVAPTSESTTITVTTSGGTASLGGISNGTSNILSAVNVTFPALTSAGTASLSLTGAVPASEPTPDARGLPRRFALGSTVTTLAYLTITFAQNDTMTSSPSFTFTLPYNVALQFGSNAYVAVYSAALTSGWNVFSGPAIVGSSNALTFNSTPLASPLAMQANVAYTFAIVTSGTETLLPSPTPSPLGTGGISGTQIDHITGIGATFDSAGDMSESESGNLHTYQVIYKPVPQQPWVLTPSLDTAYTYFGYPTIHMELDATGPSPSPLPTEYQNDKVNLTIGTFPIPAPSTASSSTNDLWEGFDVAFDPSTQIPGVNVILAQWWQGVPFSPPVDLILKANDNYECYVEVRNDSTGGNPSATAYEIDAGSCAPTNSGGAIQWHQFLFHIRFGNQNDGLVEIWHNNMTTPVNQYTGNVGYIPGQCVYINGQSNDGCLGGGATPAPPADAPTPANDSTAYFGPYRPSDAHKIIMYITNVKFAKAQADADPTQP